MKYFKQSRFYPDGSPAVGLLFLRIFTGYALASHGLGKIQNPFHWMDMMNTGTPGFFQALAAISEFFGGLAIIFGALFPLACLGVMCTMFVATLFSLNHSKPIINPAGGDSAESSALYFVIALAFFLTGPGLLAFDYFVFARPKTVVAPPTVA